MNIDTHGIQKSAIVCWRHLLRTLDGLPADKTVGSEYVNASFVAEGLKNHDGLKSILAFFTLDIPADVETRQEIFCANVNDMVALKVFDTIPQEAFEKTKDNKVAEEILQTQQRIDELTKIILDDDDTDVLDDDDDTDDWMVKGIYLEDITTQKEEIEYLKKREFQTKVNYNIYLQCLCSKLSEISSQQCFVLDETSQSLTNVQSVTIESLSQRIENNRPQHESKTLTQKTYP